MCAPYVADKSKKKSSKKNRGKSKDGDHVSKHANGSQNDTADSNGRSNKHEERTVARHAFLGGVDSNSSSTSSAPGGINETVLKQRPKTAKTAPTRFRSTGN